MIVFCYDDFYEEYKDCLTNDIGIKEAQKLGLKGCNIYDVNKLRDCKDGIDLIVCDYRRIQELARIVVVNEEKDGNAYLSGVPVVAISFWPQASIDAANTYFGVLNIVGDFDAKKRFEPEAMRDLLIAYKENRILGYGYETERSESIVIKPKQ